MNYFDKERTSGMFTSRGFSYQDHCAAIALLDHSLKDGFRSITTETLDDITVIYNDHEVLIQVKKEHLNISDFNKLLSNTQHGYKELVFSSTSQDFLSLLSYKERLLQTLHSERSIEVKNKHKEDFEALLIKNKLKIPIDYFLQVNFIRRSESDIQSILWHAAYKWSKTVEIEKFTDELVFKIYQLRNIGGELKYGTLLEIAKKYHVSDLKDSSNKTEFPIAFVQLKSDPYVKTLRAWEIIQCPYCGGKHLHGAGSIHDDPRDFLGLRRIHCYNDNYDYLHTDEEYKERRNLLRTKQIKPLTSYQIIWEERDRLKWARKFWNSKTGE